MWSGSQWEQQSNISTSGSRSPPVEPIVIEHRFHQLTCTGCGTENQAPEMVEIIGMGGYGARVAADVGLFSSQYRQSYRQIKKIRQAVFGIEMSLGTIKNLRTEVSEAVSKAVNWVDVANRQLCWAHLKRDFIQISERVGVSAQIGESLLAQEKLLFNLWYQFRNEQLTRSELIQVVEPIQAKFSTILQEAASFQIGEHEKTPLAKTVRTCRNLLKLFDSLWLFVRQEGVEPTNNAAERAIRPAVIWRMYTPSAGRSPTRRGSLGVRCTSDGLALVLIRLLVVNLCLVY